MRAEPRQDSGSAPGSETPTPPSYYVEREYREYDSYERDDGALVTERYPYWAIREKPDPDSIIGSHEIAETHSEGWAKRIVDAMNASTRSEGVTDAVATPKDSGGGR